MNTNKYLETIEELEAQVKQLTIDAGCYKRGMEASNERLVQIAAERDAVAAENAALRSGYMFFMYSDDGGFETYRTREEAIKAAQEMIDLCREDAYDGWPEETDNIRWGVVIQQATETDFKNPAPENGWEGSSDYKLLPETPATDAAIASLRAEGVNDRILKLEAENALLEKENAVLDKMSYEHRADGVDLLYASKAAQWSSELLDEVEDFAAQLRSQSEQVKGVQS